MGSQIPSQTRKSFLRLAWLLVGSFLLTIASFVAASVVAEYRARGIEAAAHSIAAKGLLTVDCLSRARTDLRRLALMFEDLEDTSTPRRRAGGDFQGKLMNARAALANSWAVCEDQPTYPSEQAVRVELKDKMGKLDAAIARVIERLEHPDGEAIGAAATVAQSTLARTDRLIAEELELNVRESTGLSLDIADIQKASRRVTIVLDALSALLAITAAAMMIKLLRRYRVLTETRMMDLEQFSSRAAHDIRSPLGAVGLALELLERDVEKGIRVGALDRARQNLQRVVRLVDDLLVFARSGTSPTEQACTDAGQVISDVGDQMRVSAAESGIALSCEPPDPPLLVAMRPGVLSSILSNLVGNAIKHMGTSPIRSVSVRTRDLGRRARFEVSDTGPGIAPALRARMFDPYVRGEGTTAPGLGLGLATVHRLVEAHGGKVGSTSHQGPGSTFWFELPKAVTSPKPVGSPDDAKPPSDRGSTGPDEEPSDSIEGAPTDR